MNGMVFRISDKPVAATVQYYDLEAPVRGLHHLTKCRCALNWSRFNQSLIKRLHIQCFGM